MRDDRDAMRVVRAELCGRIDRLHKLAGPGSAQDFAVGVEGIRHLAWAYGVRPVARLAEALLRERPGGCPVSLYLERMRDAAGCERVDEEAAQAMIASVSVRLGA